MSQGLIVLAWVLWIIAHGLYADKVPRPNNFWMTVAFLACEGTTYILKNKDEK
jgi:hypothetical protein